MKTKLALNGNGKRKLEALLKWEKLAWLVEREAWRLVRKWHNTVEEEHGGKENRCADAHYGRWNDYRLVHHYGKHYSDWKKAEGRTRGKNGKRDGTGQ